MKTASYFSLAGTDLRAENSAPGLVQMLMPLFIAVVVVQ